MYEVSKSKLWGILNVKLGSYTAGPEQGSKTNLSLLKTLPWWIKSTSKEEESQREDTGGQAEDTSVQAADTGGQVDNIYYKIREIQYGDTLKVGNIKNLLLSVPLAKEPTVLIDPEHSQLSLLFNENSVISLDTEFTQSGLAYIQIGFLQSQTVCILSFTNNFKDFEPNFVKWLNQNVLIIGFNIISDLKQLWGTFSHMPPRGSLLGKVFDLYLFFRFLHNGYKNSLAAWAKRILGVDMNKQLQKTNWFNTPLSESMKKYMVDDVYILHQPLNFYKNISHLYYENSWVPGKKHTYLEVSYSQDQILIPLF